MGMDNIQEHQEREGIHNIQEHQERDAINNIQEYRERDGISNIQEHQFICTSEGVLLILQLYIEYSYLVRTV